VGRRSTRSAVGEVRPVAATLENGGLGAGEAAGRVDWWMRTSNDSGWQSSKWRRLSSSEQRGAAVLQTAGGGARQQL
jgi:hypothetical protein